MAAVPPPAAPATPATGTSGSGATSTATIPAPPPALLSLAPGTRLAVSVTAPAEGGGFQVSGQSGTFTLQTGLPLASGTALILQVQGRGTPLLVQVLSVDGRPAGGAPAAQSPAGSGTPGAAAATLANLPAPAVGARVTATLLTPLATPLTAAPGVTAAGARQAAGTSSPASFFAAGAPAPAGTGAGNPNTVAAASSAGTGTGTGTGTAATGTARSAAGANAGATGTVASRGVQDYARHAARATAEAAGLRFGVQITGVRPPAGGGAPAVSPTAVTQVPRPGQPLTGAVSGATQTGQPIVQTPAGTLALLTSAPLPRGTEVTLLVTSSPHAPPPSTVAFPGFSDDTAGLRAWPALREAVSALAQSEPAAARAVVDTVLPRPDGQLSAQLLFFLSALRGGTLRSWLGEDASQALQRARPDLMTRLGDDFLQIARQADDTGPWRTFLVPFFNGAEVDPIRMFLRRRNADEDGSNEPGTRFVVDISLTRIGRFQIDGLVYEKAKRFDLIIRSDAALPPWMRSDITALFETALDVTGQKGGIAFRADPPGFVEAEESAARGSSGVVI